jgi:hypothetical protein
LVISETDLGALLAEPVPRALDLPVSDITAGLPGRGIVQVTIKVPARALLDRGLPGLALVFPANWLERPVWLDLVVRPTVAKAAAGRRRRVRLAIEEFRIGTRKLPVGLLRAVAGASLDSLGWLLPRGIDDVVVERGRLILSGGS